MTALDENRARNQLAKKAGVSVGEVSRMIIWGNHSSTMYPDFENALISDKPVKDVIQDFDWLSEEFISTVQKRGAAIIAARGKSSAASAASACIDHVKVFIIPVQMERVFVAVPSNGESYGIPKVLYTLSLCGHLETVIMK